MTRLAIRASTVLAAPFILVVALINLVHPFFHGLEGGSFDLVLPYLDMLAISWGGEGLVRWSHKRHDHEDHY